MTEKKQPSEELETETSVVQDEVITADTVEDDAIEVEEQVTLTAEELKDAEIKELKTKLQEEENRRLRVLADMDNTRRRATLDKEALQKYRSQEVLTNLVPVLDNFERGLSVKAESDDAKSLLTGMEMVFRSFEEALKSSGLTEIEAAGIEFDPNYHQAVMTDSDENFPSGSVLEVLQKGYTLKDRVLRPAMVKVNE
ncbi:nucleotide exchange factor GrpE [Sporosarcina sp. BI001-red]|uniref:nucleotide exchange factor GrpE n=1 Tax=Sporosarcina sp. BI001-red TaxID=2282866 RepID=UPI000E22A43D|nr:nucleotide exchange factor GrpE [Sporosarcina sp. BI001-red]REB09974.1 nucleotide exchange factor GrpE [Sporosarcina sp. BI001-red]